MMHGTMKLKFILRSNIRHKTDPVTPCPATINSDQGQTKQMWLMTTEGTR